MYTHILLIIIIKKKGLRIYMAAKQHFNMILKRQKDLSIFPLETSKYKSGRYG